MAGASTSRVRERFATARSLGVNTAKRADSALKTDAPLWTRHDRARKPGEALTSHCFVKNLKKYAKEAGVEGFHLHRTRHTFARIVSEVTGDITATQNALDHQHRSTTRVYVQRIAVKRDLYSEEVSKRWGDQRVVSGGSGANTELGR
jgi:integrase